MKNHPPNALIKESSPYLLQHANNPVQWYPWGDEALRLARENDLPILVSIGYSACHWCHVMERESFEDDTVASYMNQHFINIKIDREERPDLDHFFMDAVQAISGSGGWPLNVFLTPATLPFYGGTYYPPVKAFNRSSWMEVLQSMADVFKNKREEVERQAETLVNHLRQANGFASSKTIAGGHEKESFYAIEDCKLIAETILAAADREEGGIGKAPKFLQTALLQYLLQYAHLSGHEPSREHACFTLGKMLRGGIYDQLGGGISRYSTDNEWLVPHFEKMLYDNALFASALSEAYQLTADKSFADGIRATLDFVEKELKDPEGGYYTALDADSEGVEGKFYVWSKAEIQDLLGPGADLFCHYYNVSEGGNWDETNILHISEGEPAFAEKYGLSGERLTNILNEGRKVLLRQRSKRVRPGLDDKILLNSNALLLTAFCKAFAALGEEGYKKAAENLFAFIQSKFEDKSGSGMYYHTYKKGEARYPAFLDDYAYLIEGLLLLQEITSNQEYLTKATQLIEYVVHQFKDETSPFFYYSGIAQKDLVVRKVEVYDGATPSANAVMAKNLLYLGIVFDNFTWREQGEQMLFSMKDVFQKYPTSFGVWAGIYLLQTYGVNEITVTGQNIQSVIKELLGKYIPNKILQSTRDGSLAERPMLKDKLNLSEAKIYLCRNFICQPPYSNVGELIHSIKNLSI
jgi:uncharacterized protein YyaL (SSP411 family)